ncbi:hypothetical protein M231_06744 [Tremella mesenterica]|uniref:Uncharacterized protein n=1 Tax=Tremella mesenterica TaxID=5217 RepID=A0A4Q1BEX4_TREME|nr:hypothetical protein M231_06744 [Tremella mesenterica]
MKVLLSILLWWCMLVKGEMEMEKREGLINSTTVFHETVTPSLSSLKLFNPSSLSSSSINQDPIPVSTLNSITSKVKVSTPTGVEIPSASTTYGDGALGSLVPSISSISGFASASTSRSGSSGDTSDGERVRVESWVGLMGLAMGMAGVGGWAV